MVVVKEEMSYTTYKGGGIVREGEYPDPHDYTPSYKYGRPKTIAHRVSLGWGKQTTGANTLQFYVLTYNRQFSRTPRWKDERLNSTHHQHADFGRMKVWRVHGTAIRRAWSSVASRINWTQSIRRQIYSYTELIFIRLFMNDQFNIKFHRTARIQTSHKLCETRIASGFYAGMHLVMRNNI